ncbi:hypothetical protein H072_5479 [Dactylellina haptotyla CBS 200.50]|uniref:MaoC-like domain-containing protein n=1 Tax=Dactylellina haptotyla (strain CBS 200.50) TaxID=1284197 RepID=S8BMC4_DACHA|nr:hypothetical protein H072_5479 [Dactylellina haptotyla CBS 200.50]
MKEITLIIILFILKSVFSGLMVLIGGTGSQRRVKSIKTDMPKLSVSMPFKVSEEDVKQYILATGCEEKEIEAHNVSKMLFLSAITEPCMLLLIAKRGSPIQPLGSVNVRNTFEMLRPDLCTLSDLRKEEGGMVFATLGSTARIMKRGLEFDLHVEIRVPTKSDPNPIAIFRQVFTMLQFKKIPEKVQLSEITREPDMQFPVGATPNGGIFEIGGSDPSKWARVCKDYNPIHISGIAAKVYGLPGKIAHGNHVAALAIRRIVGESSGDSTAPVQMEVGFKRPVIVPGKLNVLVETRKKGETVVTHFAVGRGDKILVQGKYWDL